MKDRLLLILFILGLFFVPAETEAQLFGQNKPRYRSFDFNVLETPHFSIHYYTKNREVLTRMADWTEQWYDMHNEIMRDTFYEKSPLIFYNDHAEFQQTNAIFGEIGVGTGGVTEGLKNRVILPFTMINQQTQHVLGHELVHAFQFNNILTGDSTSLQSLANLPLWIVEGMAEYMSIGRVDPYTAMWMRDAVLNDDVPNIKKMSGYRYFPYRYGQAFWAFFSGTYGDELIEPLFTNTAIYGLDAALAITLGISADELGAQFTESLKTYYAPYLAGMKESFTGKKIVSEDNAGRLNVSPVISPDGKYVIFLSDRNLFSTDLFLADARDGKIIRKLNSILRDGNIDDYNFLESAGTWSPDSKQFAFIAFSQGQNVIVIKNPLTGGTNEEIKVPGITAIAHPVFSPSGDEIAFSGMVDGQTDLFIYNFETKKARQLTSDLYSEVYPDYSPDGKYLVFSSDRKTFEQKKVHGRWNLHLSRMNLETNTIEDFHSIFPGSDNLNPCYDPKGNVYFISDRDGFRNLYRTNLSGELLQMTDLKTGISGISQYSPAISVAEDADRVAYTHYYKGSYDIYQAKEEAFIHKAVDPSDVSYGAGTLPVILDKSHQIVMNNIENMDEDPLLDPDRYVDRPYRGKFKLDYIDGGGGIGASTGGIGARTGLAGGLNMIFSDILGNNQLFTTLALNGEIYDIGGSVTYLNQKRRLGWGFSGSHVPSRAGFYKFSFDTVQTNQGPVAALVQNENLLRVYQEQLSGILHYPISKILRLEANGGFNNIFYTYHTTDYFYTPDGRIYLGQGDRDKIKLPADTVVQGYRLKRTVYYNTNFAFVGDNSTFGLASPINGYRFRFDFGNYFGGYQFQNVTADVRAYQYVRPVTFAWRGLHYATFGPDARSFYPILIGEMGLVHGYNYGRLSDLQSETGLDPNSLFGNKILLTSFETRLPFTGPEQLAVIKSGALFSELAVFLDGGIAFNEYEDIGGEVVDGIPEPKWVFSTGISARVNLFGAIIIEPYYAWPLLKGSKGRFGVFLVPGW